MKYKITTMLRSGIKDNAGTAVTNTLNRINFDTVTAVRIGKVFYIDTTDDINDMIKSIINPVMEDYTIEELA
jgi:phosphoribosylformylglycinamidine (FGAM) synthase PurS component|tara:strand:+ start:49 stop:264 length:216 start_codon:yes stop_codon:yes gene_type:complete